MILDVLGGFAALSMIPIFLAAISACFKTNYGDYHDERRTLLALKGMLWAPAK